MPRARARRAVRSSTNRGASRPADRGDRLPLLAAIFDEMGEQRRQQYDRNVVRIDRIDAVPHQ